MLKYLDFLGVKPSIDACSNCGSNTNIVTFHHHLMDMFVIIVTMVKDGFEGFY